MRQDVYGVAYQEAKSELLDITCKFEQLRQRKDRLEGVVTALGPMLGEKIAAPSRPEGIAMVPAPAAPEPAAPAEAAAYTFNEVSAPDAEDAEIITDPFERRVRNALKFGGSRREGLQPAV